MSLYIVPLCLLLSLIAVTLSLRTKFSHYRTSYATGRNADKTCVLNKSPNKIGTSDIVELSMAVLWKQLFQTSIRSYIHGCYVASQKCFKLPPLTFQGLLDVDLSDAHVFRRAVYGDAASGAVIEKMHDINPVFLIAMTGPAVILLLADAAVPIRPIGALNTRNVFKIIDSGFCRNLDDILEASRSQQLSYKAVFGGDSAPAYRTRQGLDFSITITVFRNYVPVLEQQLYFLQRLPYSSAPQYVGARTEGRSAHKSLPHARPSTSIGIGRRDPRLWAASCKDYNPIHIYPLLAKAFGFSSVIAHGNHVLARIVEQLRSTMSSGPIESARQHIWHGEDPYYIETRFLRPMLLPTQLGVWWVVSTNATAKECVDFHVGKQGVLHMTGSVYEADS